MAAVSKAELKTALRAIFANLSTGPTAHTPAEIETLVEAIYTALSASELSSHALSLS